MKFKVGDVCVITGGVILDDDSIGDLVRIEHIYDPDGDTNYGIHNLTKNSSTGNFYFDDELELAQPYLNEQKLKKVLGLE